MKGLNYKHGFIFFALSVLSVLVVGLLFSINTASAAVKTVCPGGGPVVCDSTSIQAGVSSASSGDTVRVSEGTYPENNIAMKSGVTVEGGWKNDFSVRDTGVYSTVVDGGTVNSIIVIDSKADVVIDGLVITNGERGVYVNNSTGIEIRDNEISNHGSYGIYNYKSSPLIEGNEIRNNSSHGIYNYAYNGGTRSPRITENLIQDNNGYGIYNHISKYHSNTSTPKTEIGNMYNLIIGYLGVF